jgi:hypothetical protein
MLAFPARQQGGSLGCAEQVHLPATLPKLFGRPKPSRSARPEPNRLPGQLTCHLFVHPQTGPFGRSEAARFQGSKATQSLCGGCEDLRVPSAAP